MNKIYKVLWSEAKQAYVVVSELAKNHGKKSQSKLAVLMLAAAVTMSGMGGAVASAAASEHYSVNNDTGHNVTIEPDFNDKGQGAGWYWQYCCRF